MNTYTTLAAVAADRIDANPVLAGDAIVGASFPRAILAMTARSVLADLRKAVQLAERGERLTSLSAEYCRRDSAGLRARRDADRRAAAAAQGAATARRNLREAEMAAALAVDEILDVLGELEAGTTRRDLAQMLRLAAEVATPAVALAVA